MQTDPCTKEAKLEHSAKKKSVLVSISLAKLSFDKGISGDKCCHCPIWKPEASSINLPCNLMGVKGSSCDQRGNPPRSIRLKTD